MLFVLYHFESKTYILLQCFSISHIWCFFISLTNMWCKPLYQVSHLQFLLPGNYNYTFCSSSLFSLLKVHLRTANSCWHPTVMSYMYLQTVGFMHADMMSYLHTDRFLHAKVMYASVPCITRLIIAMARKRLQDFTICEGKRYTKKALKFSLKWRISPLCV